MTISRLPLHLRLQTDTVFNERIKKMTGKTLAREYLCSVVRSALLSEPLSDIPEGTDKVFLVKLAYRNSVQVILYLAFKDKPGALPQEYMSKLERSYKAAILRESAQQNELNFIRKSFC